tara:strand:+ start:1440 stop:3686 length:2247 start_codon:yes stop_codon:yes gene_type:complete
MTMFQSRVVVLGLCVVVVNVVLLLQLVRLAVVDGSRHAVLAESRLHEQSWLPTWRGSILDRSGRVLAHDEPAYDVAFSYDAITGAWIRQQAVRAARRAAGDAAWSAASPSQREQLIAGEHRVVQRELEAFWEDVETSASLEPGELDERRNDVLATVQHMAAVVWEQQRRRHEARYSGEEHGPTFRPRPIAEQEAFHVLLPAVDDETAITFRAMEARLPELVQVRHARHRVNPHARDQVEVDRSTLPRGLRSPTPATVPVEGVAGHLLGGVRRPVWEEDVARRPFRDVETGVVDRGGYLLDDEVGSGGLEQGWEEHLRGVRGSVRSRRDTGEETRLEQEPGRDLQTTIDIELQGRIEAVLSDAVGLLNVQPWHGTTRLDQGRPLNGSVVVLEIETGEVLASVSVPSRSAAMEMTAVEREIRQPWADRALEAVYPPGSIIKPLVLAAASVEGECGAGTTIECNGHHFPGQPGIARCWIYRPRNNHAVHGPLQPAEALARSCNCYFYELGDRLGLDRIVDWYEYFGLGRRLEPGLAPLGSVAEGVSGRGHLPNAQQRDALRRRGEDRFESVMLSIGQGGVSWTVLQAANAYAILARGGRRLPPTFIRGLRTSPPGPDVRFDDSIVDAILEGLNDAVTESWGTGSRLKYGPGDYEPIFNVDPIRVWGKTGTAQAPPLVTDVDGDGAIEPGERIDELHHAWFVGLAGDVTPRYAVAVLVEHGGSGGRVAGPIANQVIHALQRTGHLGVGEVAR